MSSEDRGYLYSVKQRFDAAWILLVWDTMVQLAGGETSVIAEFNTGHWFENPDLWGLEADGTKASVVH